MAPHRTNKILNFHIYLLNNRLYKAEIIFDNKQRCALVLLLSIPLLFSIKKHNNSSRYIIIPERVGDAVEQVNISLASIIIKMLPQKFSFTR